MNPWKAPSGRKISRPISPALILALVAAVSSGFFFIRMQDAQHRLEESRSWTRSVLDSLGRSVETPAPPVGPQGRDSVYWQWVAITARMDARRLQGQLQEIRERRGTLMSESDLDVLRQSGLGDPVRQLRDSLMSRKDLIPFKSELGGRMTFFRDRMILLDRPYIFAYAEDGHRGGYLLLAYDLTPDRVRWRRIWWGELE